MPDHLDLAYGDAPRARLDFFPANRTGAATLLFFHGGYWQRNAVRASRTMPSILASGASV